MRWNNTAWSKTRVWVLLAGLILGLAVQARAQSQAGTGQIVGTIFDASGAAVPGAKVTVVGKETGLTRQTEANAAGQYRVVLLPPGPYSVTIRHHGFRSYKADVDVTVGATLTLDTTLTVGDVTQVVEVTASVVVETTAPQADALINLRSIAELPINGRRFHDFVTLGPSVQIESRRNQISFVGQRGINANVTIDGADYNELFFGGIRGGERSNNAFTIPQEAIAEFQVVPYGYSVEFGRSSGGLVNATTKSGTNDFHGSAFYFLRHKAIAKKDAFERQAVQTQHQFGGSIGGPIRRDKSFFFFAIEDQKFKTPRVVVFRNLGGITPTGFNSEAFNFYKRLETPFTQTNDAISFLGRWDHQFNPSHRLAVRYHYSKNEALNASSTGLQISPETNSALSNNGTEGDKTNTVTGTWTAIFTPQVVNEFRTNFSREDRPRTANAKQAGVGNFFGNYGTLNFLPTTAFDYRVQVTDNLTWNHGNHSVKLGGEFNYLFVHQFFKFNQFGIFSVSVPSACVTTPGQAVWTLNLMSVGSDPSLTGACADPANRFDHTGVTYRVNIGNGLLDASMRQLAFYFQDAWRISPRFTLTGGLRWEGYFNPEPATSNTTLTNLVKNFTFAFGRVDPGFIPDNLRQFMPRLGFGWDPWGDSKTVIRANAGIYYAHTPLLLMAAPLNNFRTPAGDLSVALPVSTSSLPTTNPLRSCNTFYCQARLIGIDLNNLTLDKLPTLALTDIQNIANALGLTIDPNRGVAPITWADNYEAPRSWQWSVGVEREIARGWSVGGDFAYVNTIHLQRNRDWNLPNPVPAQTVQSVTGGFRIVPDASLRPCFGVRATCSFTSAALPTAVTATRPSAITRARPIPTLDSVQVRESHARAFYRGLTFRSVLRRSRYQIQAYYTFSRNLSDDDNEREAGGQAAENAFNLIPEYSLSNLDVRHMFNFNAVVNIPGGFTVSWLGRFRSARPIDPSTGADSNGDGFTSSGFNATDRPFKAPGVPFKRNFARDRALRDFDLRVAKRFKLPGERMRIDFTVDFFNLFNFDNVTYASTSAGSTTRVYGVGVDPITGASVPPSSSFRQLFDPANCVRIPSCFDTRNSVGQPFQMQVGLRFQF